MSVFVNLLLKFECLWAVHDYEAYRVGSETIDFRGLNSWPSLHTFMLTSNLGITDMFKTSHLFSCRFLFILAWDSSQIIPVTTIIYTFFSLSRNKKILND